MTTIVIEAPSQLSSVRREERLAAHAARLARRNEALEDFAALVAHDVRSSLAAALRFDEVRDGLERALELVDTILEAVRAEGAHGDEGSVPACTREASDDLGGLNVVVMTTETFPVPASALRVALRNLFGNAIAAGATRIWVATMVEDGRRTLVVDDDGCGLGSNEGYAAGAGLGLWLCQRLLNRLGASLQLSSGRSGGTRAAIVVQRRTR